MADGLPYSELSEADYGDQASARDEAYLPELRRAVVEQVEVVGIVAFLLDDLELDVLVVEVGIVAGRIGLAGEGGTCG